MADELMSRGGTQVTVIDKGPLYATGGSSTHALRILAVQSVLLCAFSQRPKARDPDARARQHQPFAARRRRPARPRMDARLRRSRGDVRGVPKRFLSNFGGGVARMYRRAVFGPRSPLQGSASEGRFGPLEGRFLAFSDRRTPETRRLPDLDTAHPSNEPSDRRSTRRGVYRQKPPKRNVGCWSIQLGAESALKEPGRREKGQGQGRPRNRDRRDARPPSQELHAERVEHRSCPADVRDELLRFI